jgi:hypothetical protein
MISKVKRRYYHYYLGSLFYIGWYDGWDKPTPPGDEAFGIAVWRLYLGRYDGKWCFGILDKNGCLN